MEESNTLATTKQAAQRAVDAMTRPEGMTRVTWAGVQVVLEVIAQSYPKAYPSQRRISDRSGIPIRSVQRYIALAVAANLLVVEADAGAAATRANGSKTNRYYVKLASSDAANLAREEITSSYGAGSVTPSRKTSSSVPSLCSPSGLAAPSSTEPHGPTVVSMNDWLEQHERSRQVDPDEDEPPARLKRRGPQHVTAKEAMGDVPEKKIKRRPRRPPDRWDRLVDYFGLVWEQMVLDNNRFRPIRPVESRGQVRKYLRAHYSTRTDPEIRKMMDEFVIAVSRRRITIKQGQSAWMCFTGAWGRQRRVVVEADRYAAYTEG